MDKSLLPQQTDTMESALDQFEYAKPRFGLQMFSVFAGIGLVLVSVGVYSVVSYTVSQQQREIGIRMALGASAANVRQWVMVGGMRFILVGVALGLLAAFVLARVCLRPGHPTRSRNHPGPCRTRRLLSPLPPRHQS